MLLGTRAHSKLLFCLLLLLFGRSSRGYYKPVLPVRVPTKPKVLYFTGAGVFFFWQLGACKYIKETCAYRTIPILGASAGSLTGSLLLSDVDLDEAVKIALTQGKSSGVYDSPTGLAGELGNLLYTWLDRVLPDDLDMAKLRNLQVAITPTIRSPKLVNNFTSKRDLVDACLASCHVPVFLDGRPTTMFRGEAVIDGSFWYFATKDRVTGLPRPPDVSPDEVFWIDYGDDDEFLSAVENTNFLATVSPEGIFDMIDFGYNYMKREHYNGRLPLAIVDKPSYVLNGASLLRSLGLKMPTATTTLASEALKWFVVGGGVDLIAQAQDANLSPASLGIY